MSEVIQFPKEPMETGRYFGPANRPQVAQRWLLFTQNGHPMQAFFRGNCLYCSISVWSLADGTTMEFMGAHALRPVFDEDGNEYVACNQCGSQEGTASIIITQGKAKKAVGQPWSPLVWPEKHPMHKMASL